MEKNIAEDTAIAASKTSHPKQDPGLQDFDTHTIPLEQRTDVTVGELEKLTLPYPAELYNGKVFFKMANYAHGLIQGNVFTEIKQYLSQNPIGDAVVETNFQLWPDRPKESRIPDIAYVSKDRLPENQQSFPVMVPDLAVEIISPKDNLFDVMDKVDDYLQ